MTAFEELIDQTVLNKQQAKALELLYLEDMEAEQAARQLDVDVEYLRGWRDSGLTSLREAANTVEVAKKYELMDEV